MNSKNQEFPQEKHNPEAAAGRLSGLPALDRFATSRLHIAHWRDTLADPQKRHALKQDLRAMLTDPVVQHLPPSVHIPGGPNPIETWIKARLDTAEIYLIRDSQALAGLMFLFRPADAPAEAPVHLGYLFHERVWGDGYASELVQGLVAALATGPALRLQGGVDVNNPASARVLIKAGFAKSDALSSDESEIFERSVGQS